MRLQIKLNEAQQQSAICSGMRQLDCPAISKLLLWQVLPCNTRGIQSEFIIHLIGCETVMFEFCADSLQQRSKHERQRVQKIDGIFQFAALAKLDLFFIRDKRINLL